MSQYLACIEDMSGHDTTLDTAVVGNDENSTWDLDDESKVEDKDKSKNHHSLMNLEGDRLLCLTRVW